MNLDDPQELDATAGEYVLGTLAEDERARFVEAMERRAEVRAAVEAWEERLSPLAAGVRPVEPPRHLWSEIVREVGLNRLETVQSGLAGLRRQIRLWRLAAAGAAVAAAALAVYIGVGTPGLPSREPAVLVAVLQQSDAPSPAWLVRATGPERRAVVQPVSAPAAGPDKDYELWSIAGPDAAPRSLGVISQREETRFAIPDDLRGQLASGIVLAISLEPKGGSPTGQPTGPVVFTGELRRLSAD